MVFISIKVKLYINGVHLINWTRDKLYINGFYLINWTRADFETQIQINNTKTVRTSSDSMNPTHMP
jgi:hypothetical protein